MHTRFLYFGPTCWGGGDIAEQAYRNCRKELPARHRHIHRKRFRAWRVHPDTTVSPVNGQMEYPREFPPVRLNPVTGLDEPMPDVTGAKPA